MGTWNVNMDCPGLSGPPEQPAIYCDWCEEEMSRDDMDTYPICNECAEIQAEIEDVGDGDD